ncbi:MAG: hypothetical protein QOH87_133, partial [Trebonia sp.]|nr:hypothetical protein [Trebonia sp.]
MFPVNRASGGGVATTEGVIIAPTPARERH